MMTPSLLAVIQEHAQSSPHSPFLIEDKDPVLTYQQAFVLITKLVSPRIKNLYPFNINDADGTAKVILVAPNSSLYLLALLGLWQLGLSVVPLSTTADPHLWAGMINIIKPLFILSAPSLIPSLQRATLSIPGDAAIPILDITSIVPPDYIPSHGKPRHAANSYIESCVRWLDNHYTGEVEAYICATQSHTRSLDPNAVAITLFTSSAVDWATLKCVSYTHEVLYYSSERALAMLGGADYSASPKRHLGWLPLSHCFEFCITFCSVVLRTAGAYIFLDPSISSPQAKTSATTSSRLLDALVYHSPVTATTMLPSVFEELIRTCSQDHLLLLQKLHSVGVGGAPTSEEIFQWAASNGIPYFDCSGATEMAGTICIRRAWDRSERLSGLKVIPGVMGMLKKTREIDLHGELVLRGTYLPNGYDFRESSALQYDEATQITTYFTGDIYSHQDGSSVLSYLEDEEIPPYNLVHACLSGLTYVGRLDDILVLSSGLKVDAPSLEKIITEVPGIECSTIVANKPGDSIVALVLPSPSAPMLRIDEIISSVLYVNTLLPFEKRLHRENIVIVKNLPRTTKGVVNRKLLKKLVSEAREGSHIYHVFSEYLYYGSQAPNSHSDGFSFPSTLDTSDIMARVVEVLSRALSLPPSHFSEGGSLVDSPLTSLSSTMLARALQTEFGVPISAARLYGLHSVEDIVRFIAASLDITKTPMMGMEVEDSQTSIFNHHLASRPDAIAISGASCRFTGGIDNLNSFWSALLAPEVFVRNCSPRRPESRWPSNHPEEAQMYPSYWLDDEFLNNTLSFSKFFRISPKDVAAMSPNARLALQLGYEAIQDAGIAPQSLRGKNWGVFTSVNDSGWKERKHSEMGLSDYSQRLHGSADDAVGARLSYFLDLTGPAFEIKSACSSSAVALHQARLALMNGDCEAAIIIAATTHFHPAGAIFRASNGIVSPSGRCNPFSELADGFVASEGAAAMVLQRSNDAKAYPYSFLKMTGVGQDGASHGFYAPNLEAQKRLFKRTLANAEIEPQDISLVEAHGTGTQLGDAIELQAISDVFDEGRDTPLFVGSAKAVLGHTEECAGLVGVLKVMLCLSQNIMPPQPVVGTLTRIQSLSTSCIVVPSQITALSTRKPILASISSFGLSGTLANVILQSAPLSSVVTTPSPRHVFLISAFSASDFKASVARLIRFFQSAYLSSSLLEATCRTTQVGRDHFEIRCAWEVDGWNSLLSHLRETLTQPAPPPVLRIPHPKVGFWFALPGPTQDNRHPSFLKKLDDLSDVQWRVSYHRMKQQLALAQSMLGFGILPSVVGGEGVMELVAAIFVGIIPSNAAFRLTKPSHQLCSTIAVKCESPLIDEQLVCWRHDELSLVGKRGDSVFVLQGVDKAVSSVESVEGIALQTRLPPPTVLTPIPAPAQPKIPIVSAHLGEVLNEQLTRSPNYWYGVQDRPFDSAQGLEAMLAECDYIVHLGLPPGVEGETRILSAHEDSLEGLLAALYQRGCHVDWDTVATVGETARIPPYTWSKDE